MAITLVGAQPYVDWTRSRDADFNPGAIAVIRTKSYGSAFLLAEFELEEDLQDVHNLAVDAETTDTGLVVSFLDRAALDAYQTDPRHVPVAELSRASCDRIVSVDFEA